MANVVEMNTNDRVMPVRLTDEKSGKVYELDFNREAVRFAEARGFKVNSIADFPATAIPELFYLSFRAHHKNVSRSQTDALLDRRGGMSAQLIERLNQLYAQAALTNVIAADEDAAKNGGVTVEL